MWGARLAQSPDGPALEPFDPNERGAWRWVQPRRARRHWRLVAGGRTVATLDRRSLFGFSAIARFRDATWVFRRQMPFDLMILPAEDAAAVARWRFGWLGGGRMLDGADAGLRLKPQNFWCTRWALLTPELLPLVRFQEHFGFLSFESTVSLEDAARRSPTLSLWVALGWYLIVRHQRRHGD
ncbi:MAG TPA: hypothetical protein VMH61_00210 [Candidatus Acidoferrales bacterium]|nr:hypothetical protein [Candidatus Acidoferrales bacterium]